MDDTNSHNSTTNATESKKRHYYIEAGIGAVMFLVILVEMLVIYSTTKNGPYLCSLSRTRPQAGELADRLSNIASKDNSALANLIGHVYFYGQGFMPLVLTELEIEGGLVTLTSECATLTWRYSESLSPLSISLSKLTMKVPLDDSSGANKNSNGTWPVQHCQVPTLDVGYDARFRFSCRMRAVGICQAARDEYGYSKPVAEVVLDSLEIELLGDMSTIKTGHFSTLAYERSCRVFT